MENLELKDEVIRKPLLSTDHKIKVLIKDIIIREELCNFNCEYCLTQDSKLKPDHSFERKDGIIYRYDKVPDYSEPSKWKSDLVKVMNITEDYSDSSILKINGGEFFVVKNAIEFVEDWSKNYNCVQIITNGSLLNEDIIKRLAKIPNINIQMSLDGHTFKMNSYRVRTETLHLKLLKHLDLLIQNNIQVEINSVLTDRNIENIESFTHEMLQKYGNKVFLLFYPVRGNPANSLRPSLEQIKNFRGFIDNYNKYESILPPQIYIRQLADFLETKKRTIGCRMPMIMYQVFDDGSLTHCPACWITLLGNLLESDPKLLFDSIGKERMYNLLVDNKPHIQYCKRCYTTLELINMYFQDLISLDELCKQPSYNHPETRKRLTELKVLNPLPL